MAASFAAGLRCMYRYVVERSTMACDLLNGPCGRTTHLQVRTERVTQDMHGLRHLRATVDPSHDGLDHLVGEDSPVRGMRTRWDRSIRPPIPS